MLGFLGTKVLGQFDPFFPRGGRLLLVAPNIVHAEREIGADPTDFRLWVCLHEETHRVQFTANPWLGEHLLAPDERRWPGRSSPAPSRRGPAPGAEAIRSGNGSLLDLVSSRPSRRRSSTGSPA